mmetsp:Transcript_147999/g.384675  ORF Transcript_147999/g.384675 Transcript_147999/m.384675 type:complete len:208 (-) Transcript_147999:675-1298(-)
MPTAIDQQSAVWQAAPASEGPRHWLAAVVFYIDGMWPAIDEGNTMWVRWPAASAEGQDCACPPEATSYVAAAGVAHARGLVKPICSMAPTELFRLLETCEPPTIAHIPSTARWPSIRAVSVAATHDKDRGPWARRTALGKQCGTVGVAGKRPTNLVIGSYAWPAPSETLQVQDLDVCAGLTLGVPAEDQEITLWISKSRNARGHEGS